MTVPTAAHDRETMPTVSGGQHWLVSWHPADAEPEGRPHGAAGICVGGNGRDLVLISPDQVHWGFPAGRPEGAETPRETLSREMREEACVEVLDARLLGFSRSECIQGHEQGLVLVRSYWLAQVEIGPWEPQFEIVHRRIVPAVQATTYVRDPDPAATRISMRALAEAGADARATGNGNCATG
jgi:8-oxo-dGTP pyrophosphatase MutT (NUDIX family)